MARGVTVARLTLDQLVLVRIQAGQQAGHSSRRRDASDSSIAQAAAGSSIRAVRSCSRKITRHGIDVSAITGRCPGTAVDHRDLAEELALGRVRDRALVADDLRGSL